jgi:hypothetical protein
VLELSDLTISRVVVFDIPMGDVNKGVAVPTGGLSVVNLTGPTHDMVVKRLTKVLGKNSHGIEATFDETEAGSFFQLGAGMMSATDADFRTASSVIAKSLAKAQSHRPPPCKLIVVGGEVTVNAYPFLAVIKAELQEALTERSTSGATTLNLLTDIFMTESQRLYKVGFMQRSGQHAPSSKGLFDSKHFAIHLFDHLVTKTETRGAAAYFYRQFLGCEIANSARSLTRNFFEQTVEFLNKLDVTQARRIELHEALRSELRSNSPLLSVDQFATAHFDTQHIAPYKKFMEGKNFPTTAVVKDTEYVKSRLRRRHKVLFSNDVMITTPADKIDLIQIAENDDGSTNVRIQGKVQSTE